ncbi:MAG: IS1595 family transposase [Parvularculaceae bacterium]
MAKLQSPIFTDETKAREHLEAQRWAGGRYCPHCGEADQAKTPLVGGKKHRPGLYYCNSCKATFTVTVGTVFERSKVALTKWLLAFYLLTSSKKGFSAHQLHRTLGVTYKTAWFMAHRIREAMAPAKGSTEPLGGEGKTVEADETYFGKVEKMRMTDEAGKPFKGSKRGRGPANKRAVIALVERGGKARTFHPETVTRAAVEKIIAQNVAKESRLHTDESHLYAKSRVPWMVAEHSTVRHSEDEYVRGDVTSNSVEGYFSVFKRGMRGTYQHCAEKHLHRYLAEFDFRFNNRSALGVEDAERADEALRNTSGKRLTYRPTHGGLGA